jgi:mono/diheme cytochrome c family protein
VSREREIKFFIMRRFMIFATVLCFSASFGAAAASAADKGDAAKGKQIVDTQCSICHNTTTTETKMGPSLKGLFQRKTLKSGKPVNDKNVLAQINGGGNGMPAYGDQLTSQQKANILAYLHTL